MTNHAAPLRKEIEDLATSQIAEVYYAGRDHPRLLVDRHRGALGEDGTATVYATMPSALKLFSEAA